MLYTCWPHSGYEHVYMTISAMTTRSKLENIRQAQNFIGVYLCCISHQLVTWHVINQYVIILPHEYHFLINRSSPIKINKQFCIVVLQCVGICSGMQFIASKELFGSMFLSYCNFEWKPQSHALVSTASSNNSGIVFKSREITCTPGHCSSLPNCNSESAQVITIDYFCTVDMFKLTALPTWPLGRDNKSAQGASRCQYWYGESSYSYFIYYVTNTVNDFVCGAFHSRITNLIITFSKVGTVHCMQEMYMYNTLLTTVLSATQLAQASCP